MEAGAVIGGRYKIIKVIGRGGMGTVYLAEHYLLGQKWAIKEFHKESQINGGLIRQSLLTETNILKKLCHPNLPQIIDVIQTKEKVFLVMEYIEGITLTEIIETWGAQKETQVIKWAKEICDVLIYLHTRTPPIIYCDLKPSNIMVKEDGKIMLIDFGTAQEYYKDNDKCSICWGTEYFAAPEQFTHDANIDARTDIYAFGMTICALLTGITSFRQIKEEDLSRQYKKRISEKLMQIIMNCTKENPDDRYQDSFALKLALSQLEEEQSQYKDGEKKKRIVFCALLAGWLLCVGIYLGIHHWMYQSKYNLAISYVNQAEKAINEKNILKNYRLALELMPAERKIYDSLSEYFISPNDFNMEKAAVMMNLLETISDGKKVMSVFRDKDPEGYSEFSYNVGIGYFYYIGGIVGKKEARSWFKDVVIINCPGFSEEKRKRATLYEEIGSYYDSFIENGKDNSGESSEKNYEDFYKTLHELNEMKITKNSMPSDAAAVYMISKEIAIEIGNHAMDFLGEKRITSQMLMKELLVIEGNRERENDKIKILETFFEKGEMEQLTLLVREAKRKVILAEQENNQREG